MVKKTLKTLTFFVALAMMWPTQNLVLAEGEDYPYVDIFLECLNICHEDHVDCDYECKEALHKEGGGHKRGEKHIKCDLMCGEDQRKCLESCKDLL